MLQEPKSSQNGVISPFHRKRTVSSVMLKFVKKTYLLNGLSMSRVLSLFLTVSIFAGCSQLPCKPPSYYSPDPAAPYTAEEVRVVTKTDCQLAGTLTLPVNFPRPFPAVVLITGSHPQNRDMAGSIKNPIGRYRPFRQIADALSCRGIAVLRMDDRGVGCSEGGDIANATIPERAEDIKAGIRYLKNRNEVDAERIGLIGISEGGNIGPMIASEDPTIRAIVIMAGSASTGRDILEWQVRYDTALIEGVSDEERSRILKQRMTAVEKWIAEADYMPWRKSFVEYNPLRIAHNVCCPVLILHGDRDAHVPVEHAHLLANEMRKGGNRDVTVKILADHNHLFLKDKDGRFSNKRYLKLLEHTNRLSDELLTTISDWIYSHLAS